MKQKEDILDILIYLFESYMGSGNDTQFLFEPDVLLDELESAGFETPHVTHAVQWLVELRDNPLHSCVSLDRPSLRIYSDDEKNKISIDIRSLIGALERDGVINCQIRELIIDRAMALGHNDVDIDHVKWIMLFVLCFNNHSNIRVQKLENVIMMEGSYGTLH